MSGPQTIREWQKAVWAYAKEKGWHDLDPPRTFSDLIATAHSELSEAFEAHREGHAVDEEWVSKEGQPEGIPVEFADVVLRILDTCECHGIDLQAVMERKHAFNLERPFRHGGKVV